MRGVFEAREAELAHQRSRLMQDVRTLVAPAYRPHFAHLNTTAGLPLDEAVSLLAFIQVLTYAGTLDE